MLFQEKAGFTLTAQKEEKTTDGPYKHLLMGETYGVMTGQ